MPPQPRFSLHNQIKTSLSQTIFKQSEPRCDSGQESTGLCSHEKDITKRLCSNSKSVARRDDDPLGLQTLLPPAGPAGPTLQLALLQLLALPLRGGLGGKQPGRASEFSHHWQHGRGKTEQKCQHLQ